MAEKVEKGERERDDEGGERWARSFWALCGILKKGGGCVQAASVCVETWDWKGCSDTGLG